MAVNDRFLLTLRGAASSSGTAIQNAFVYEGVSGLATAADLGDAFVTVVLPPILSISNQQYVVADAVVQNLDDLADYTTVPIALPGLSVGEYLPIYNAYAFEFVRTTRAIQNGRKAIGIVSESDQANGNPIFGVLEALNTLANAMLATIAGGTPESEFAPRLWRRPGTYDSGVVSPPGLFYPVGAVTFKRISTQSTRKIGRGA